MEEYKVVKPKPYKKQPQKLAKYIRNNTFVVFDLETTGLKEKYEKITEIGAVKIVNGKITEVFETFVNPHKKIPAKITELTGITDDMVKDAPNIEDVLPDFKTFVGDSVLIAQNIQFDYKFLKHNADKIKIEFNNKQKDTLDMFRHYLPFLHNHKLGTVCEELGISLENAHRAYEDALATAKAFLLLARRLPR